jgi:RNA polymerase sigma factor (sigma-70 family)
MSSGQGHDRKTVERAVEKLARGERLSAAEREMLAAALTPLIWSVVRKVVWRRGRSNQAYQAALEEAFQEAWLLLLQEVPRRYSPVRGSIFAFVKTCLRPRLLDWMDGEERRCLKLLTDPEAVEDTTTGQLVLTDGMYRWLCSEVAKAGFKERRIFKRRMAGYSYADIAPAMGMSVVATRLVMYRLVKRLSEAASVTDV